MDVLFEDNHCLAVNKPAGLPSQGDETGDASLVDVVTRYLKDRYRKPGNVYVGLLHRLDRPTSGVVLLAKTSKAARRLSAQFRAGAIAKVYWAAKSPKSSAAATSLQALRSANNTSSTSNAKASNPSAAKRKLRREFSSH